MTPIVSAKQVDAVRTLTKTMFNSIGQGHGMDHMLRVEDMALRFANPGADTSLISIIALLHDADDYKLFPAIESDRTNARRIMAYAKIPDEIMEAVCKEINRIGYSKRLAGKVPATPEGMAVSDADMCDIMGATGILRLAQYDAAHSIKAFDKTDFPDPQVTEASYLSCKTRSLVRHMFEKVLRLPGYMLTDIGRHEALTRKAASVAFLEALFREQGATEWMALLDKACSSGRTGIASGSEN